MRVILKWLIKQTFFNSIIVTIFLDNFFIDEELYNNNVL